MNRVVNAMPARTATKMRRWTMVLWDLLFLSATAYGDSVSEKPIRPDVRPLAPGVAAQANDKAELRAVKQDPQASPYGQSWRELMESHWKKLAGQVQAAQVVQLAEPKSPSPAGWVR